MSERDRILQEYLSPPDARDARREWWYVMDGADPMHLDDVARSIRRGDIGPLTFVWKEGTQGWVRARESSDLAPVFAEMERPTPPPPPPDHAAAIAEIERRVPNMASSKAAYLSAHSRARWALLLLWVGIAVDLIGALVGYAEFRLISRVIAGETVTAAEAGANDARQGLVGVFSTLVFVATAVAFLVWLHRAHRNLPALGATGLKFSPGWAVGYFFIPIVSLWRPYQAVKEVWKASDPEVRDPVAWHDCPGSAVLGWWWTFWLLSVFARNSAFWRTLAPIEGEIQTTAAVAVISNVLSIAAALFAILVVGAIGRRQEEKYVLIQALVRALTPAAAPTAQPATPTQLRRRDALGTKPSHWFILVCVALAVLFVFLVPVRHEGVWAKTIWDLLTRTQRLSVAPLSVSALFDGPAFTVRDGFPVSVSRRP